MRDLAKKRQNFGKFRKTRKRAIFEVRWGHFGCFDVNAPDLRALAEQMLLVSHSCRHCERSQSSVSVAMFFPEPWFWVAVGTAISPPRQPGHRRVVWCECSVPASARIVFLVVGARSGGAGNDTDTEESGFRTGGAGSRYAGWVSGLQFRATCYFRRVYRRV